MKKLKLDITLRNLYLKEIQLKTEEKILTDVLKTKGYNPKKETLERFNEVKNQLKIIQNEKN